MNRQALGEEGAPQAARLSVVAKGRRDGSHPRPRKKKIIAMERKREKNRDRKKNQMRTKRGRSLFFATVGAPTEKEATA
jgi:hypothetical protein